MSSWGAELLDILKSAENDEKVAGTDYDKMVQCGNCHAESPKGTKQCPKCGNFLYGQGKERQDDYDKDVETPITEAVNTDFSAPKNENKEVELIQCPNCDTTVSATVKTCPVCKHKFTDKSQEPDLAKAEEEITADPPPETPEEVLESHVEDNTLTCPNCGVTIPAESKQCPSCHIALGENVQMVLDDAPEPDKVSDLQTEFNENGDDQDDNVNDVDFDYDDCPNCGRDVEPSMAFCPYCGTPLKDKKDVEPEEEKADNEAVSTSEEAVDEIKATDDTKFAKCPECGNNVALGTKTCPVCGHAIPVDGRSHNDAPPSAGGAPETAAIEPEKIDSPDTQFGGEACVRCDASRKELYNTGKAECPNCGLKWLPIGGLSPDADEAEIKANSEPCVILNGIKYAQGSEEVRAQKARSKQYGIAIKDKTNVTKPGKWKNVDDGDFLDPVNYSYPVHDATRARNAAARWANQGNKDVYSDAEQAIINKRLDAALKKFKIGEYADKSASTPNLSEAQPEQQGVTASVDDNVINIKTESTEGDKVVVNGEVDENETGTIETDKSADSNLTKSEDDNGLGIDFSALTDDEFDDLLTRTNEAILQLQKESKAKKRNARHQHSLAGIHSLLFGLGWRNCTPNINDPDHDGDNDMADNDADETAGAADADDAAGGATATASMPVETVKNEDVTETEENEDVSATNDNEEHAQLTELLKETREELETVNSEYEERVAELQSTKDAIKDRAATLNRQDDEISTKETRLTELNTEIESKHKALGEVEETLKTKSEERDSLNSDIENARTQLAEIEAKHASAKKEYELLLDKEIPSPVIHRIKPRPEPKKSYGNSLVTRTTRENITRDRS